MAVIEPATAQASPLAIRRTSPATAIVEVEDLLKIYPAAREGGAVRAVDGVSFRVGAGEFFGFLGPNGAGKTTTIRILATLTRPTSGRAAIGGIDVLKDPGEIRRRIGLAMQTVALENM